MTDKGAGAQDRRLWQRWRTLGETSRVAEPDALLLAAYAEGRLTEADAEPVEAWLAAAPEVLADVIAARSAYQHPPQLIFERRQAPKSCRSGRTCRSVGRNGGPPWPGAALRRAFSAPA